VEELHSVDETWDFKMHHIKRTKSKNLWHIGLLIFLSVNYPVLSVQCTSNRT